MVKFHHLHPHHLHPRLRRHLLRRVVSRTVLWVGFWAVSSVVLSRRDHLCLPERELVRQRGHFRRHLQHLRGRKTAGRYDIHADSWIRFR